MNKAKKRPKRKKVGNRSAKTGKFVDAKFAARHPDTTVAVTKEAEPTVQEASEELIDALAREAKGDEEC
jgi:hypothetical protein